MASQLPASYPDVIIYLVDVSPPMHRHLDQISKSLMEVVDNQLENEQRHIALVISGTDGTCNPLHQASVDKVGSAAAQHLHITVAHPVQPITDASNEQLINLLDAPLPRGGAVSNWVDGVRVCLDMVAREVVELPALRWVSKKLIIVSNFMDKAEEIDKALMAQLLPYFVELWVFLEIVCLDGPDEPPSQYKTPNTATLHDLQRQAGGSLFFIDTPDELEDLYT